MDIAAKGALEAIVSKETWSADDHRELMKQLFESSDATRRFRMIFNEIESENAEPRGAGAVKVGIVRYMACRFQDALAAFANATDNKERRYFQAQCFKNLRQFDKAAEELQRAADRGWDSLAIDLEMIEVKALAGEMDAATKALNKLEKHSGTAMFQYLRGLVADLRGDAQTAIECYTKARQLDPRHPQATFRLAYAYDLHGEEEQAIELYRQCLAHPPIHANALLNLAVLYEDSGRNELAISCLRRIVATNPGHARARLFLRDVEAAKTMFYDEDQAKRVARRNAVLDIPVTDFELSVRARNCLKKMNVRTLGDLVRTSESDLLAYKNFGETSLKEIKEMLSIKGLRLGQAAEDEAGPMLDLLSMMTAPAPTPPAKDEGLLATPIAQVDLSIRARKAIEGLKIETLGDLAGKSEAELLSCKNFGQTSLNEIVQRLSEYGLRLKENF